MQVAGYIMEGDPQLPEEFVDWGMQPDDAYLMPSLQGVDEAEHERVFGIQRDEPCGCRKLSIRMRILSKVTRLPDGDVKEYTHSWRVHTLETCDQHKESK